MERLSDNAINIIDELHTERLHYFSEYIPLIEAAHRLAEYEDTELSPEEFKESVNFVLELNAKVHKVIKDLKYYLDTNEENGVVYIPKFVIEKMVDEHLKTNF